ncbi:MAG: beta-propeller domain-containing protein [Myxococcales bacterium]
MVLRLRLAQSVQQATSGALVSVACLAAIGCSGGAPAQSREVGQSDFASVSPGASQNGRGGLAEASGGATSSAPGSNTASGPGAAAQPRTVEETDLYRLEGDRLYYLNSYRGLMVFDVSNVDAPKLLGRSPIYGSPVEMLVRNGIASVVVADWYGTDDKNEPFYGSIVRGIDATDPAHMKILGDARLGGWVRDTRVVGDVLYAVTESYGTYFGAYYGVGVEGAASSSAGGAGVSVASVNIAGGKVEAMDSYVLPGNGGIFNVTANSILLAHSTLAPADQYGYQAPTGSTELVYLDISDPTGVIRPRGSATFSGYVQGWGADNGRWNLDFADGKTAHALACGQSYCGNDQPLVLATVDFSKPDQPVIASTKSIPSTGWAATARFDAGRMYLTPGSNYYYGNQAQPALPLQIWDLADPKQPALAGETQLAGEVWNIIPAGNRLFALGNEYVPGDQYYTSSQVSLRYLDVSDPAAPKVIGTSKFGDGWAWTPAAGTFKAFTMDKSQGLVVLPFSGWDNESYAYNNGLQLIEFTDSAISTAGAAKSPGWTERGIFVKDRLVSLSDLALSVVDYSDHSKPVVVSELTLARNVVNARPLTESSASIAELSSDWWGNDVDHSTLRIVPVANLADSASDEASDEVTINGQNAQTFHNGSLAYVVSNVCATPGAVAPGNKGTQCTAWTQEVQVVDYSSGKIVKRGVSRLPAVENGYYSYYYGGFYGCFWYDWYDGGDVLQVGSNALAFRRWIPTYDNSGNFVASRQLLYMMDLEDADSPSVASTVITSDPNGWWGNMRAIGDQLYTSHYEWERPSSYDGSTWDPGVVRYYVDHIDYTDRAHPRVGQKVNVPGLLVGASETDPSLIYTIDYRWNGDSSINDFDVLKLSGDKAYLQSSVSLPGWVGSTFVRGDRAYMSSQSYAQNDTQVRLVELDLGDPLRPRVLSTPAKPGWGWLVGVEGDRALVSSGWANQGIDVYRLSDTGAAPVYDQFIRTRGWGVSSLARQNQQLFLSSGYWGTEVVNLDH